MKGFKYILALALATIVFMPAAAMAKSPRINFSFNVDFFSAFAPRRVIVAPPVMIPCPPPAPVYYYPIAEEKTVVKNYYYYAPHYKAYPPYMPY